VCGFALALGGKSTIPEVNVLPGTFGRACWNSGLRVSEGGADAESEQAVTAVSMATASKPPAIRFPITMGPLSLP
jgi:hypothetical protein